MRISDWSSDVCSPISSSASAPEKIIAPSLVSHADVNELLTRYADALDDGRVDDWPDFFVEDGIYQITTRENEAALYPVGIVYCEGRGMLLDRVKALKIATIFESHVYCHINGQPTILKPANRSDRKRQRLNSNTISHH